ncbi:hypothetical protein BDN72DRAFT_863500 [Pluteus cervinus]|uniref:Uncharacterized protein n=1 Tax=Pluteus cervinus TaxID=181527 RepID=A0ACD3A7P9_9AGAR|nr:hypothetical protein BDN72DRAFT_863500 [Pluteus cervinus]
MHLLSWDLAGCSRVLCICRWPSCEGSAAKDLQDDEHGPGNVHQYDGDADGESEEPLNRDSREAFVASKMIRFLKYREVGSAPFRFVSIRTLSLSSTFAYPETCVSPEVPPNGLNDAQKPTAYSCTHTHRACNNPKRAPRRIWHDQERVTRFKDHPSIASASREGKKLSRSIGEVGAGSSEDEPLIKRSCHRQSNDGRDEEQVEEPADDEEQVEEPTDNDDEGMVGVDEAPAACGANGGGSNSNERASSNSEVDEGSDSSASGIRWKGNREDRRKAEEMYQTYLESNKNCARTLISLFLRAENPRESIPLPSCLCKVLRDDMSFLPEAACASAELTMEILLGDNGKVKCLTHWWRGRSSSNLAKDRVGAYNDGVKVVDCGCSIDVMLWEFFLLKTFKLAPPYTAFPLLHYNSRDGMTAAIMELLGITRAQELFNSNGTGWHDPQHQQTLKKQRLALLMADLGQEDIKGKKEESPGPLDNMASPFLAPVRRGASSLSRSARSVASPGPEAPSLTPIRKKLRSAKATDKRKAG